MLGPGETPYHSAQPTDACRTRGNHHRRAHRGITVHSILTLMMRFSSPPAAPVAGTELQVLSHSESLGIDPFHPETGDVRNLSPA
jgi:hypothetical protein